MTVEFVTSAAGRGGFPRDGLPEIALVGRSNVGKSSLINAATRTRLARTSAAPGKTRLANIYRVDRRHGPFYLVDLPGYGYARGGSDARASFDTLSRAYFERGRGQEGREGQERREGWDMDSDPPGRPALPGRPARVAALLLVDARHPELASDHRAWAWLTTAVDECAVVATKIDKLARGERIRAMSALTSVYGDSVLPCSAVTGEGLDELWKLIDRLLSSPQPTPRSRPQRAGNPPARSPSRRSSSPHSRK
ncbi:MAG: GTP-binding protein [Vicinamibacterales bacterium]